MKDLKDILYTYTALLLLGTATATAQSQDQNYVRTTAYNSDTDTVSAGKKTVQVAYLDGLGRPSQQRAHAQSATGKDLVTHFAYDIFGRPTRDYLPYPASSTATLNYDASAATAQAGFYSSPPAGYEATAYPYSEKFLENSPLNRVLKQAAPGEAWKGNTGNDNDHTIRMAYLANTANEVKLLTATSTWSGTVKLYNPAVANTGTFYAAGQLYKTVTRDENWTSGTDHTTEEFTDKQGRVVLKRTYESGTKHDTYYVYDQFGNLACVLPPKADGTAGAFNINSLCFVYRYDARNRLVEKKLPGKQWEYIVYDNLDRVVATGPALSPFPDLASPNNIGWLATKYDAFGRTAYTAWVPSTTVTSVGRKTLQDARSLETANLYENRMAGTGTTTVNGVAFGYTNKAWPTSAYHVLTVSYYDDYSFPGAPTSFAAVEGQDVHYNLTVKPKGLPTGSWVRVLEGSTLAQADRTYILYDKKGRAIRTDLEHYTSGHTVTDTKLDFAGKAEHTVTHHTYLATDTELYVKDAFTYTPQQRLLAHTHQIGASGTTQLLALNTYDELGQLVSKRTGGTDVTGAACLQKIDYSYNIRGWLKEINNTASLADSPQADLFAFKIGYQTVANPVNGAVVPLYNGNIAETFWKGATDFHLRSYSYAYDPMNRLKDAYYHKNNQPTFSYDEHVLEYDRNGNITKLERNGDLDMQGQTIQTDYLTYAYDQGNQLQAVGDDSNHPAGFRDGAANGAEYRYDDWGNMTADDNKGITAVTYNHLNLPTEILFSSGSKITYLYDAAGAKLRKSVQQGVSIIHTDYLGGFQYINGVLSVFRTAEGYVKNTLGKRQTTGIGTLNYIFNLTDHLGNIRMTYTEGTGNEGRGIAAVLEENNYYPFGLKHEKYNVDKFYHVPIEGTDGYNTGGTEIAVIPFIPDPLMEARANAYKYKYNGKEFQDELGLNYYDYGARNYDPALGRWMNIDPLAEKFSNISPYVYVANSPLFYIDPDGRDIIVANKADRAGVLKMINSKAVGTFAFDKSGKLYLAKSSGDTSKFSTYYRDKLVSAINDKDKITISISETFKANGKTYNTDKDAGGGATLPSGITKDKNGKIKRATDVEVIISGNENKNMKDTNGKPLTDLPADILAHELVGHAIPLIAGKDTGNAVSNENKVRAQVEPGKNKKRQAESKHVEF